MTNRETILAAATGIALLITAPVHAGGLVLSEEDATVAEARPSSEGNWILPVLVGIGIIAILSGKGGGDTCFAPEPETDNGGGC